MRARIVTEISCYLDNKPGILGQLTSRLAEAGINIQGMQAYEGSLQSLVMMVVDKTEEAEKVMRSMGITLISLTDILEVDIPNRVGGFAEISTLFGKHGINIKSIYSADNDSPTSAGYIRVDEVERSQKVLNESDQKPAVSIRPEGTPHHRPLGQPINIKP